MKKSLYILALLACYQLNAAVTFISNKTVGCSPLVVIFKDNTVHPFTVSSRTWTFDNGLVITNNNPLVDSSTMFYTTVKCYSPKLRVCYTNGTCDSTTNTNMLCVNGLPQVSFNITDSLGCITPSTTHTASITNNTNPVCGTINSLLIEIKRNNTTLVVYDSAATAVNGGNFSYTFPDSSYYEMNVSAKNSCGCTKDTTFKNIVKLYKKPTASFTGTPTASCDTFINSSFNSSTSVVSNIANTTTRWDYGDGSAQFTGFNPSHLYNNTATPYSVKMVLTETFNGGLLTCKDSMTKPNYISCKNTKASFTAPLVTTGCTGSSFTFVNTSDPGFTSVMWDYGDGSALNSSATYTYNTAGTFTVKMFITYPGGCLDSVTKTNIITVNPTPKAAFKVSDSVFCAPPRLVDFTNQSTGHTSSNWTFTNGTPTTSVTPSPTGVSFSATGAAKLVVSNAFGCKDSISKSNYINFSGISANFTPNKPVGCLNDTFTFTNTSAGLAGDSIVSYKWDFNQDSIYDSIHTSKRLVKWIYSTVGCTDVKLEITTQSGCIASSKVKICVGPKPSAAYTLSDTAPCIKSLVNFTYTGSTPVTKYNWYFQTKSKGSAFGAVFVQDSASLGITSTQYTDTGSYYPFLVVENNGCKDSTSLPSEIKKITVNGPIAGFANNLNCLIDRKKVNFVNNSISATKSWWDFGVTTLTTDTTTVTSPSYTYPDSGCYTIRLVVFNNVSGCYDTTKLLKCIFLPSLSFTAVDSVTCAGKIINYCNTSTPAGSISFTHFDFLGLNGAAGGPFDNREGSSLCHTFIYNTLGYKSTNMVTTDQNGCKDTMYRNNNVLITNPTAKISIANDRFCINQNFSMTDVSTYPVKGYKGSTWTIDVNPPVFTKTTNTSFSTAGSYHIKLQTDDSAGCSDILDTIVNILDPFSVAISKNRDSICPGQTITYTNIGADPLITYKWTFQNATPDTFTGQTPPPITYNSTGKQIARCIAFTGVTSFNCADTTYDTVTVYKPVASFTQDKYVSTCDASWVTFTDNSKGSNITSLFWDFGEGQGLSSGPSISLNKYDVPGVYKVTHIVETVHGCRDTIVKDTGFFISGVFADVSYKYLDSCGIGNIELYLISENAGKIQILNAPQAITIFHDTSCGVPGKAPCLDTFKLSYFTPGVFVPYILVDDRGGCPTRVLPVTYSPVRVLTPPKVKLKLDDSIICVYNTINFEDSTAVYNGFLQRRWDLFGTPATSTNAVTSSYYDVPGTYTVKLWVEDSTHCVDSMVNTVKINPKPIADFSSQNACSKDSIKFVNTTVDATIMKNWWHFGVSPSDTAITVDAAYVYTIPGPYTVTLQIVDTNGCMDTVQKAINVYAPPVADFDSSGFCVGVPTLYNNKSVKGTNVFGFNYSSWTLDPGTSNQVSPTVTYTTAGVKNVKLVVTDVTGCKDSITKIITIFGSPTAAFTAVPAKTCFGSPIKFTDASVPSGGPITNWDWDLDGAPPIEANGKIIAPFVYTNAGNYLPNLTITDANGCKASSQINVVIVNKPVVEFTYNAKTCIDTLIDFVNTSPSLGAINNWSWYFGEDPVNPSVDATTQDTKHAYYFGGKYKVTLIGIDSIGCKDTVTHDVSVDEPPVLIHVYPEFDTTICVGNSVLVKVSGAQSYNWGLNPYLKKVSGDDVVLITPPVSTIVRYTGTNGACPEQGDSFKISVVQSVNLSVAAVSTNVIKGQQTQLKLTIKGSRDSIAWTPAGELSCNNCLAPYVSPQVTTTYKAVVIYSLKGYECTNTDSVTINVSDSCTPDNIVMPNAFTPSAATNNKFYVMGPALNKIQSFKVFDRWGNKIFERLNFPANDPNYGWDGKHLNSTEDLEAGVYIYQVIADCANGATISVNRDVTLIR